MPYPLSVPVVMTLPAAIDMTNADQVRGRLYAAIASGAPLIIADLSATVFCDAAGADWLRMIGYHAAARSGRLRLVIPPGALMRRILELLGVDHLLAVYSSITEACEPLTGPRHPLASLTSAGWVLLRP
jgi:anti-anti-sigma regulatory factor